MVSDLSREEARVGASPSGPRGIGGWLILPLLGLVWAAATQVFGLNYLGDTTLLAAHLDGPQGAAVAFKLVGNLVLQLAAPVVLCALAVGRKRKFPVAYIVFTIVDAAFVVTDFVVIRSTFPQAPGPEKAGVHTGPIMTPEMIGTFLGPILGLFIWSPYMYFSKRVKNTFVN